ncbi:MAG: tetratricopeptide repeat protein [Ardenticatenales bacterium]
MFRLNLLGRFNLERIPSSDDAAAASSAPKTLTTFSARLEERLLAYLALRPDTACARVTICEAFWPGVAEPKARKLLSLYLFHINQRLIEAGIADPIEDSRESLRLRSVIRTDVQEFAELVLAGMLALSPVERAQLLYRAVDMYGAGLLPSYEYAFVTPDRERMQTLYDQAVRTLARALDPSGELLVVLQNVPPTAWQGVIRAVAVPSGIVSSLSAAVGAEAERSGASPANDAGSDGDEKADIAPPAKSAIAPPPPEPPGPSARSLRASVDIPPAPEPVRAFTPLTTLAPPAVGDDLASITAFIRSIEADLAGPNHMAIVERIEGAVHAIDAVLSAEPTAKTFPSQLYVVSTLARFWYLTGRDTKGRRHIERLLATRFTVPDGLRAQALHAAGTMANCEGDTAMAIDRLREAVELRHRLGDDRALLQSLINLALAYSTAASLDRAHELNEQAIAIARRLRDEPALSRVLFNAAQVDLRRRDAVTLRARLEERLGLAIMANDPAAQGATYATLGSGAMLNDEYERAEHDARLALAALESGTDHRNLSLAHRVMGYVCYHTDRLTEARDHLSLSVDYARAVSDMGETGVALSYLALVHERLGDAEQAALCSLNATALLRATGTADAMERYDAERRYLHAGSAESPDD